MELTKKEKTIKYVVYCLIFVLGALLQNVAGAWLQIGRARCFFLIPLAILVSLDEDEIVASLLGLFAGVLWDVVASTQNGFNAIFLMVICYIMAVLISHLMRATYWLGVVASVLFTFLYMLIYWLVFVMAKGSDGAGMTFWYFYFPSFIYTSFMAAIMNIGIIPIKKKLNKSLK